MPFNHETGIYELENISFVNSSLFTEAADCFKKNGYYTKAPKGSTEYKEFWKEERRRMIEGVKAPANLTTEIINGRKVEVLKEVHITGKHYGFLNYGRINMVKLKDDDHDKELLYQTGKNPTHTRRTGTKSVDFPRFIDGQYHWFKAKEIATQLGLNTIACKARRKGFSYMEGYDCASEINIYNDISVLVAAYDTSFLFQGNQIMAMAKRYLDWFETMTPFSFGYLKEDITDYVKLGYKRPETGHIEYGKKSMLIPVTLNKDAGAAAGKDAKIIKFEECGANPVFKSALDITLSTTEDGDIVTGRIDAFGTGGTKGGNWVDFENVYYNPASYNFMAFDNIWDKGLQGTASGFFYPQEVGNTAFLDKNGNSLKEEAIKADNIEAERQKKIKDQAGFIKWRSQRARCGRDAFSNGSENIFPINDINDHRFKVEHDPNYKYLGRYGTLLRTENGIRFISNETLKNEGRTIHEYINNFPLTNGQDVTGCYVEWYSPHRDKNGKIPNNLYRIWHDPYAFDKDKKDMTIRNSLGASYVYMRPNNIVAGGGDILVACYIGRPEKVDDYNEMLMRIAEYWNAQVVFEKNRGDVEGYFKRAHKLHLLADSPEFKTLEVLKINNNKGKGILMNEVRKINASLYLRDWLLNQRNIDSFGNSRLNLHYIFDVGVLSELGYWNLKGNFDRVSALLVGMLDVKEHFELEVQAVKPESPLAGFFNSRFKRSNGGNNIVGKDGIFT